MFYSSAPAHLQAEIIDIQGNDIVPAVLHLEGNSTGAGADVEHTTPSSARRRCFHGEPTGGIQEVGGGTVRAHTPVITFDDVSACVATLLELREQRLLSMMLLMVAAMAARAREIEGGARPALDHDAFVANLTDMLVGVIEAPASSVRATPAAAGLQAAGPAR